jgi:hypothetical protein
MATGSLARLFWCVVDVVDYWLTQAQLNLADAVCGPKPETAADEVRETDRERLQKAFPEIGIAIRD